MAIEDYYRTLTVLKKVEISNGIGGKSRTWETISTIQGVINQSSQNKIIKGKLIEDSVYKCYTEINSYITDNARIQDDDGKIYRVKGTPKNTMRKDHHLKIELIYADDDNE